MGIDGSEAEQYAVYILAKAANDYINAQMRDIWVQRLEMLIPRLTTKDEKLKTQTENAVMTIASEITDVDARGDIQTILKKNLLPKSTDMFTLSQCFERLETLFKQAYRA
jgi:cell division FtsZ-interacting protein ZapD